MPVSRACNVELHLIREILEQADFIESVPEQGGAKLNQPFGKFSPGRTRERAFRKSEEIIAAGIFTADETKRWKRGGRRGTKKEETGSTKLKNKEQQAELKQWKWYRSSIPSGEIRYSEYSVCEYSRIHISHPAGGRLRPSKLSPMDFK